ncbi:mechanosensitive ion channel family protein [Rhodobacteraceae bacterium 63075]|nr:mechanosensitive ion channel family protein [Rhodobacteraceae bacterium 63075]
MTRLSSALRALAAGVLPLLVCLALGIGAVQAQTNGANGGPDYEAWTKLAERIEDAVEAGLASDAILENLRDDLSDWRNRFAQARELNARTIAATQAQIDAFGPEPGEGEQQEPDTIAAQREELKARLAELEAPSRRAEVAQSRADVLIREIDQILSRRQTDKLLERGPSPLNPGDWTRGFRALKSSLQGVRNEFVNGWNRPNQRAAFMENLPAFAALVSLALVSFALGWRWIRALSGRFVRNRETARGWLLAFALSLLQLLVALAGLFAIGMALHLTEMVGLRLDPLIDAIFEGGFYFVIIAWLSGFVFARDDRSFRSFALDAAQNAKGRHAVVVLGGMIALKYVLDEFARYDEWSAAATNTVYLPVVAIAGLCLWRLGRLLRQHSAVSAANLEEGELPRYVDRMYGLMGRALLVVGIVGPVLLLAGYFNASMELTFQTVQSLLLIALIVLGQRVLAELWALFRRDAEGAREGLIPTLAGFMLVLIAVPEFLRIWGMSDARISGFWLQAREGFIIGETRITAGDFLTFAIVFVIGYTLTRLLQGALKSTVLPKTRMDQGGQNALVAGIGYVGIFLAALVAITSAGIDLSSLAIVAGALSVGIGFGLQNIVSNFVSGIILLIERPISEGDWIEVGGTHGVVRDISVRSTRIETFDRSDVILPNADLISGRVTNYTHSNTVGRVTVPVGVAYGSDTRRIEKILMEIATEHPMVLARPEPYIVFQGFGSDSLDFEIRAILRDVNFVLTVHSDMNHEIARRFAEEGIEIPFAQRDVWIRNPETLTGGQQAAPKVDDENDRPAEAGANTTDGRSHITGDDMESEDGSGGEGGSPDGGDGR